MFTNEEGEGWQQLGEGLMPSSTREASAMLDGFGKMGEQTIHGLLGGTSMPDLKDALGAMYNPKAIEMGAPGANEFPKVDFFDSSAAAAPTGGESMMSTAPTGGESMISAAPTGGESMMSTAAPVGGESMLSTSGAPGSESLLSSAFPNPGESLLSSAFPQTGGETSLLSAAGPSGGESMLTGAGPSGTVETLQMGGADMMSATPGAESAYFQPGQGAGVESVANVTDAASPAGDIGKAITDIMSKMTDMIGAIAQGPMGFLGSLLNFFLTIFSEILSSIGQAMAETARAAASLAADAWKKHLEMTT